MPVILPIIETSQSNKAAKTAKGQRELTERKAQQAQTKLASDQKAAIELAAAQVEDRKRALARNKALQTGPLGLEEGGQRQKKVLGQ